MTRRLSLVAIGIVIVGVGVHAQVPGGRTQETTISSPDPVNGLTLEEAVGRALEREPGLRASQAQIEVEQRRYLDLERAYTDVLREAFDARQTLKEALGESR